MVDKNISYPIPQIKYITIIDQESYKLPVDFSNAYHVVIRKIYYTAIPHIIYDL